MTAARIHSSAYFRLALVGLALVLFLRAGPAAACGQKPVVMDVFTVRQDPRLQSLLDVEGDSLKLRDLLKQLEKTTRVKFTLDPKLGKAELEFGIVQMKKSKAWMIMNMIIGKAKAQWNEAKWLSVQDGYLLTANSVKPRPKKKNPPFFLRADPALQHKVTVKGIKLSLGAILKKVEEATCLELTVDPELANHQPDFGEVRLTEVPAWAVLEMVARKQLQEGRWDKTETGYQLTAQTSLAAKVKAERQAAKEKAIQDGPHPLAADPRLAPTMTLIGANPPLSKILKLLRSTTGLAITTTEELADHDPKFGSLQFTNAPAWMVMEKVADHQLVDGKWEKTPNGYRLTGKSNVPIELAKPNSFHGGVSLALFGVLIVVAILFFALIFTASFRARSPAVSKPQ